METVTLALNAMNTRFELVLHGGDPVALRAAGEEALREITRLEGLLSAFQATSEIAHINARASAEAVRVSPEVFDLLVQARELWEMTTGALDITVGSLMRCWGFWGASGKFPNSSDIEKALDSVGMQHVELDSTHRSMRLGRGGMTLDLGAIGKGYAIDQAVEILKENGVCSGLLHGGTSTTYAIGSPPEQSAWRTAISAPTAMVGKLSASLPTIEIRDESLSVSSVAEKSFKVDATTYGHVIDPRTGWPVAGAALSAVVSPRAITSDALSTALLVMGSPGMEQVEQLQGGVCGLLVETTGNVVCIGFQNRETKD